MSESDIDPNQSAAGVAPEPDPVTEPEPTDVTPTPRRVSWASQLLIGLLMAALGFGVVVQVRQTQSDEFMGMRQDDLVKLLDEVTRHNDELAGERSQLRADLVSLQSGSDQGKFLETYANFQGVLAGVKPVDGPGVRVTINDPTRGVIAQDMVHMLQELRNAGAEAISVNDVRMVAGSYFVDTTGGILTDGEVISPPYRWKAIGAASTISVALNIPGGALTSFRNSGASVTLYETEDIQITAVRELGQPDFAIPNTETK